MVFLAFRILFVGTLRHRRRLFSFIILFRSLVSYVRCTLSIPSLFSCSNVKKSFSLESFSSSFISRLSFRWCVLYPPLLSLLPSSVSFAAIVYGLFGVSFVPFLFLFVSPTGKHIDFHALHTIPRPSFFLCFVSFVCAVTFWVPRRFLVYSFPVFIDLQLLAPWVCIEAGFHALHTIPAFHSFFPRCRSFPAPLLESIVSFKYILSLRGVICCDRRFLFLTFVAVVCWPCLSFFLLSLLPPFLPPF